MGIDISAFRSKSVSRALAQIGNVDLVLCFEQRQAAELARRFPKLSGKIFGLSSLAHGGERQSDIADSHGASRVPRFAVVAGFLLAIIAGAATSRLVFNHADRLSSGLTPAFSSSAADSCLCVVEAG